MIRRLRRCLLFYASATAAAAGPPAAAAAAPSPAPPPSAVYRNNAYVLPTLGQSNRTWIFSNWGDHDETFNPPHSSSVSLPLYGSVHMTAYWFADVKLGTPHPQLQSLIADTGSSVMGFPCSDCRSCGRHVDPAYDASASNSVKPLSCAGACPLCTSPSTSLTTASSSSSSVKQQCAYHIRYTEGSALVGSWYTDKVWLQKDPFAGDGHITTTDGAAGALFELPFGCHSEETHLFVSQEASGILGLEGTSRFGPPPFATAVLADLLGMNRGRSGTLPSRDLQISGNPRSKETKPVVSMCVSASGGVLTVGDVNKQYHVRQANPEALMSFFEVETKEAQGLRKPQTPRQPGHPGHPGQPGQPVPPTLPSTLPSRLSPPWAHENLNNGRFANYGGPSTVAFATPSNFYYSANQGSIPRFLCEEGICPASAPSEAAASFEDGRRGRRGLLAVEAVESVLRSSPQHYQPLPAGLVWTPLALDFEEEGGWPGSYVAVVQQASVKGAAGTSSVTVPFNAKPTSVRAGSVSGLPALVDSGTTLTYLPFMMYANLWTAILRNVVAAKDRQNANRRRLTSSGGNSVVRISGAPAAIMRDRLQREAAKLLIIEQKLTAETAASAEARQMARQRGTEGQDSEAAAEAAAAADAAAEAPRLLLTNVRRDLMALERIRNEIDDLMQMEQIPAELDGEMLQEIASVEESARPRALVERGGRVADREGIQMFPDDSNSLEKERRRRLSPVSLPNLEEECWYFANIEQDVKHFPDIKFVFANGAEYIWRPSSFLYRKGKTRVFCLTIIADKEEEVAVETRQAVLGSSFFIDHDLVFHLGNWGLGFAEARCPTTDLRRRLNKN